MVKAIPALAALAAASVLVVPTVSHAQDLRSTRVHYGDLNLASQSGQSRLQQRIGRAADRVCDISDARDLVGMLAVKECRSAAITGAQPAFSAAVASATDPNAAVLGAATLVVTTK